MNENHYKIKLQDYTPTHGEVIDFFNQIYEKLGDKFSFVYENKSYSSAGLIEEMQKRTVLGRTFYDYLESLCEFQNRRFIDLINNPKLPELFLKASGLVKLMADSRSEKS